MLPQQIIRQEKGQMPTDTNNDTGYRYSRQIRNTDSGAHTCGGFLADLPIVTTTCVSIIHHEGRKASRKDFPHGLARLNFDPDMAANCVDAVARCHRKKIEQKETLGPSPNLSRRLLGVTMMYKMR